jgi:lipid-A-disaccharide synthase
MNGGTGHPGAGRSPLDVFLVAGEASGDALGAGLMRALAAERAVIFRGVGGPRMEEAGLKSLFPIEDLTAIGVAAVVAKLPTILRRLRDTVEAILASPPDVLVLIDAPDFTHRVADRVRPRLPRLPIAKYVSPTVWFWRPGRAKAMRRSIDLVLALLPFEPAVHRELGGPTCVYVGHPVLERLNALRPSSPEARRRSTAPPVLLVLPGSRSHEIRRLCPIFGQTLERIAPAQGGLEVVLPTLPRLAREVADATNAWPIRPRIVHDEDERHAAFRCARAALAASGTVTLELALAGVPHVAAYRIPLWEGAIARAIAGPKTVVLANWVVGENVIPEFLQTRCRASEIAPVLAEILGDTPARHRQIEAFKRLDAIMAIGETAPSAAAARAVLRLAEEKSRLFSS